MEYYFYEEPVSFAIIKNFYNFDDIEDIHTELNNLKKHLGGPEITGTARGVTGVPKKDNQGLFLDEFYKGRRDDSTILKLNRKVFSSEVQYELKKGSWFFRYLEDTVSDSTLASHYNQGDYYKSHQDQSFITAIYYTWKTEFEGGDLYFGDFRVPIDNNCLLVFPSKTEHRVSEVTRGEGRWALSQFISMQLPNKPREIIRYLNFLDVNEFSKILVQQSNNWKLGGESQINGKKFWYLDLSSDPFYTDYLKRKIEETVKSRLELLRVYANGHTFGQDGEFHQDAEEPGHYTFLLYTNIVDNVDSWGGETQFKLGDFLRSYQPVTNFFNSTLWHRGLGPSRDVGDAMRVTIAWKFRVA